MNPRFSTTRISLLDRGFVYAIAHIRGGQYLGRDWYEDGRIFNKKNTFKDFISASEHLIENNYTSPNHLYAMGGSAGGLLMGAVMNMSPELYNGVISAVPFVDVVTTMLDESIPLTTGEYDEWGNPNEKEFYDSLTNQKQIVYISKQFAAKEAIAKAIGTGIRNDAHFKNIEILRDKNGAPIFNALNKLK